MRAATSLRHSVFGPAIAASVLDGENYATVLGLGIGLFALAWLLILPPLVTAQRRSVSRAALQ